MTWLTWRQFRTNALVIYSALAVLAVGLAITGPRVAALYRTDGRTFFDQFAIDQINKTPYLLGVAVVYALPALLGAFWGAPLIARELESGTHRLVWNQSITRNRWLASKLGLTGLAAAVAGLISLAVTWWCVPLDKAINNGWASDDEPFNFPRISAELFGARGIVPVGYAVAAFVIGVTAGIIVRRVVPAMAVTLAVVVALQIVFPLWIQPHLLTPKSLTTTITTENLRSLSIHEKGGPLEEIAISIDKPGAWITANQTVDSSGQVVGRLPSWTGECAPGPGEPTDKAAACFARMAQEGYRQRVEYQPASRYWPLQWIETAILFGLALALSGFSFWWLRHRTL